MTAEYLDRSSLVARMKYYEKHTTEESGEHYAYSVALREIRNAHAADVAPVVSGHKVDDGGFYARCSQCDGVLPLCANYCPNCGAKMDGGADNA